MLSICKGSGQPFLKRTPSKNSVEGVGAFIAEFVGCSLSVVVTCEIGICAKFHRFRFVSEFCPNRY